MRRLLLDAIIIGLVLVAVTECTQVKAFNEGFKEAIEKCVGEVK